MLQDSCKAWGAWEPWWEMLLSGTGWGGQHGVPGPYLGYPQSPGRSGQVGDLSSMALRIDSIFPQSFPLKYWEQVSSAAVQRQCSELSALSLVLCFSVYCPDPFFMRSLSVIWNQLISLSQGLQCFARDLLCTASALGMFFEKKK